MTYDIELNVRVHAEGDIDAIRAQIARLVSLLQQEGFGLADTGLLATDCVVLGARDNNGVEVDLR
jgi:hypothetical protein